MSYHYSLFFPGSRHRGEVVRILVIRVGRLGDMVMITPAFDSLLEKYPEARFSLLTSRDGQRLFTDFHPRIEEIWTYERKTLVPHFARRSLAKKISDAQFDAIYCFETNPSYLRLCRKSLSPVFALGPSPELIHFSHRCLQVVDPSAAVRYVRVPLAEADRQRATKLLQTVGIEDKTLVLGFHPSFSKVRHLWRTKIKHKLWPISNWGRLARLLVAQAEQTHVELRIIMELIPAERPLGEAIVDASGGKVTLLTPTPDFGRYKGTLSRVNLLVSPDTGPMHLASALQTPVVALFSGKDPRDCGPYVPAERVIVLRAEETACPEKGLAALTPEMVFDACCRLLPLASQ